MTDYQFADYRLPDDVAALAGTAREATLRGVTFKVMPIMDARDFGALSAIVSGNVEGNLFDAVNDVIRNTLVESERERWDAFLMFNKELPIQWGELVKFADDIATAAVARPTVPPSPSGSSNGSNGTQSTVGSGSTAGQVSPLSISGPN